METPKRVSKWVILGIWVFTAIVVGIPNIVHRNEKYYGPNGYCELFPPRNLNLEFILMRLPQGAGLSRIISRQNPSLPSTYGSGSPYFL